MLRPIKHYALWTLLLTGLLAAGWQLSALYAVQRDNMAIRQLLAGEDIPASGFANAAIEVRLARAQYFKERKRYDEALATLNLIVNQGDAALQAKIRYNLGNVYLQQALEQREALQINAAMTLAGLAKQAYRQALALDSGFWDAKYNLDVAMRLAPEMDRVTLPEDDEQKRPSPRWTTAPGFPRGLP